MKKLTILLLLTLSTLLVMSQDKHQCAGKTKVGAQCMHKTATTYCKQHDPATPRCGASTKAGQPCKAIVKVAGTKCHNHVNQ